MAIDVDDTLFPVGFWAALGAHQDIHNPGLRALVFDGAIEVADKSGSTPEILDFLDAQSGMGLEFTAVASKSFLTRHGDEAPDEYSDGFLPLDAWSMIVGISPRLVRPRAELVAHRLGVILDRLASLDTGVLGRSNTVLGWSNSGEQGLIRAALVHSHARHGVVAPKPPELAFMTNRERPERIKRIKTDNRVDPGEISRAFDPGGPISHQFAAWEPRPQQRDMATAIATRLRDGGELIAEAGTGTGKSLAYLVPALTNAVRTGEQVVVATNTKVLQDQLASKDAPVAVAALKEIDPECHPRVQVLKGRGNYLCLRRWFAEAHQPPSGQGLSDASFKARANIWLSLTESGELSEFPLGRGESALFNRISADGEACDASKCHFQQRNQCFLYRARRSAEAAHIVITNHALLLTDIVQNGEALPDARHLVIDEAHHLEDQATSSFQVSASSRLLNQTLNTLSGDQRRNTPGLLVEIDAVIGNRQLLAPETEHLERVRSQINHVRSAIETTRFEATAFFTELANIVDSAGERSRDYSTRIRLTDGIRHGTEWSAVERRWDACSTGVSAAISNLAELQASFPDIAATAARQDIDIGMLAARVEDLENRLGVCRHELTQFNLDVNDAIHNPKSDQVYWIEARTGDRREAVLHSAPLQLGNYLRRHLYSRLDSLVLTSATMTTGDDTRFIRQRLGLEEADEVTLSSPFDFQNNAMILIPSDLPEPNQPGFDIATHRAIYATALAANGRTLVLFTSIQAMNQARLALSDQLRDAGLQLVTQHEDGSAEQLAERLRSFDRTVVFGAGSFWEGVDVPGPALSALVIAKLPFPVPTDPIHAARSETFDSGWTEYTMPQTILKLRQGFGRLIRTQTDRGVCVILDRRLISKRYGSQIVNSLPNARREYGTISQMGPTVARFLAEGEA